MISVPNKIPANCLSFTCKNQELLLVRNHLILLFYFIRALNLCRIFTELGESYLQVIVDSPGKVSLHVLYIQMLWFFIHFLPLSFSVSFPTNQSVNNSFCWISCFYFSILQGLGDLRTLSIILTCVKHHQYEVTRWIIHVHVGCTQHGCNSTSNYLFIVIVRVLVAVHQSQFQLLTTITVVFSTMTGFNIIVVK